MRTTAVIPNDLRTRIERELEPGEKIVWTDMPAPKFFTPASTSLFVFGVFVTGFAVYWICSAAGFKIPDFKKGSDFFPLFGLPMIFIGLGMLSTPVWAYRKALRTVYAVTDKRAIIIEGGWVTTIRSFPPDKLHDVYRKERRDGSGDVILERREWAHSGGTPQMQETGFLRIKNPREVERMLRKLVEQNPRIREENRS